MCDQLFNFFFLLKHAFIVHIIVTHCAAEDIGCVSVSFGSRKDYDKHVVIYKKETVPTEDELEIMKYQYNEVLKLDPLISEREIYDAALTR